MSVFLAKMLELDLILGCLSDTDYFPEFGYDEVTGEYTCEPCLENEEFVVSEEDELVF